ncbi:MAG TPA: prepilin-type N-terminal cleavage/methylation domain-containing protein [Tepidisphaeraceae bacterium]|nr:prepilin-type N-terminal cleavage/methylation domain-containing protein [Tepidisphaeraceae bacterium]
MRCHPDTPVRPATPRLARRPRRGFTLIEAALTTVIIGVGVVGMLELLAKGTIVNGEGSEMTTGLNLAKNVREFSMHLNYRDPDSGVGYPYSWGLDAGESATVLTSWDDVDDMTGRTFNPPIDGGGTAMTDYAGWQQKVTVQTVDPSNISSATVLPNGTLGGVRVTVDVLRHNRHVCTQSWYVFDGTP